MQKVGAYGAFEWIDPPMCERSASIIPGLLRRINNYERVEQENAKKLLDANESIKSSRVREKVMWVVIVVLIAAILFK